MSNLIQFESVRLSTGDVTRVEDLTCAIPVGSTAIVGESGAGKTSLLNLIAGQEQPQRGNIRVTITSQKSEVPIYWAPQTGGLWLHWSVSQHIREVLPQEGQSQPDLEESTDELLHKFDLHHRRAAFPGELSMGERSRLSIARALAVRPAILLMDEPLAHVDISKRAVYWNVIREHLTESEASLVFTTHEPAAAIAHSRHVICLHDGRLVHQGATRELYDHPPSEEAGRFLGPLNWFDATDAERWLRIKSEDPIAVRPERLTCVPDSTSSLNVVSSCDYGSSMESVIRHEGAEEIRTIYHRPFANSEDAPDNVRLEVMV